MAILKARVVNPGLDVTLEGESVPDLRAVLKFLREEKLIPQAGEAPLAPPREAASHPYRGKAVSHATHESTQSRAPPKKPLSPAFKVDEKSGELTALRWKLAEGPDQSERTTDAALLVLYGKELNGEGPTYGATLMSVLKRTGYTMARIDRPLEAYISQGLILTSGKKRSRAYQLTETGKARAKEILVEIATAMGVPP